MVWLIVVALIGYLSSTATASATISSPPAATATPPSRSASRSTGSSIIAFILCAVTAGFAGLLQAARINEIEPSFATLSGFELKAIAAVVVGGVSLFGGRGAILGMVLGAALLDIVDNLLVLLNAPETLFKGFLGAIIIVAVVLNTFIGRRSASVTSTITPPSPMTAESIGHDPRGASATARRACWTRVRAPPGGAGGDHVLRASSPPASSPG